MLEDHLQEGAPVDLTRGSELDTLQVSWPRLGLCHYLDLPPATYVRHGRVLASAWALPLLHIDLCLSLGLGLAFILASAWALPLVEKV